MKIEILGPGCSRCFATERNVKHVLNVLNMDAEVIHVHDPKEFAKRGVLFTPAVVIDGVVKSSGKVPTVEAIQGWLAPSRQI